MINLLLALLFSTLIMVSFKLFERFKIDNFQAIVVNYLVAALSGFVTLSSIPSWDEVTKITWLPNAMVIGFFFIVVFFVFAYSAQKAGIAITAVSSKMSVVIPVLAGVFLLRNDHLSWLKVLGILLALMAFYLTFKRKEKVNLQKRYFLLPLLLFLGNGTNDTLMSYTSHIHQVNANHQTTLLMVFVFSTALLLGGVVAVYRGIALKKRFSGRNILAGTLLGVFNFLSTYFFFRSLDIFPNSVFFPVFNVGIVSMSALIGYFVFGEQLRRINWIGIATAILAILVIAWAN